MRCKYSRKRGKLSPRVNGLIETHVNRIAQKTRFTERYFKSRFQPSDKRPLALPKSRFQSRFV
ncbi:hypothetical protein E2C01_078672 [Portunus trituberculatus]|uniref:Uncharacterized protein n=1 Tax=Portunus trituberculatus TaxID=210409 RepID=A0A5B7IPC4_PORTR|nr:hypothetical protein [Portunus trituberculatus]